MRTLSSAAAAAIAAPETGEEFLVLVTIDHDDLADPIRVVDQAPDVTSRGNAFTFFPFSLVLPWEREDQLPVASIRVDAVDRQIVAALRSLTSAPSVTVEIVLRSSPDTLEYGPYEMQLRPSADYDSLTIEGTLGFSDFLAQRSPGDQYTPDKFPGMFP